MSSVAGTNDMNRATRIARWVGFGVPGLLLLACVLGVVWLIVPYLFPQFWASRLSRSQGKVELLAAAGEQLDFGSLSPDGRWIVMHPMAEAHVEDSSFLWDMATNERKELGLTIRDMRWLTAQQILIRTGSGDSYIIDAQVGSRILADVFPRAEYQQPGGLQHVQDAWRKAAPAVYVIYGFGMTGYTVITLEQDRVLLYNNFGHPDKEIKALLDQVSYVDVPKYARISDPVTRKHTFSPDGQFYVTTEVADNADVNARAAIYTRDGELVASAYKAGWTPYVLGWAHDGSGVYMHFVIAGSAASMLAPYVPLFKLSPYTPEEQRRQTLIRIGAWRWGLLRWPV